MRMSKVLTVRRRQTLKGPPFSAMLGRRMELWLYIGIAAIAFNGGFPSAAAATIVSAERLAEFAVVHNITAENGVVSGVVVNNSGRLLENVKVLIRYEWLWEDEFSPGHDRPVFIPFRIESCRENRRLSSITQRRRCRADLTGGLLLQPRSLALPSSIKYGALNRADRHSIPPGRKRPARGYVMIRWPHLARSTTG